MKGRNILVLRMLSVAFVVLLAWAGLASAQSLPRQRRLPPHKDAAAVAAAAEAAAKSTPTSLPSWQLLTTQPPVLNYALCGPGNPLGLTLFRGDNTRR